MIYKIVSALTSWVIPTKRGRDRYRENLKHIYINKNIKIVQNRYLKTIKRLRNDIKSRKIKIIFLNSACSKWAYQSTYEAFSRDNRFEVKVILTINKLLKKKKFNWLNWEDELKKNYNFFKNAGINVEYAYDFETKKEKNIKEFEPDIIFYDEMYERIKNQTVEETSKYALNLCCSYGSCISNGDNEFSPLYKLIYTYFIDNPHILTLLKEKGFDESHIKITGQPKLDEYLKPINEKNIIWKTNKKRIIYAPHYSFYKSSKLCYGTFNWSGKFLLEYALKHKEYEFIIKPHPSLKRQLVNQGFMSIAEAEKYFNDWAQAENAQVYDKGAYFDMFRTSDLLITDCNSFLYEYLPALKPVIHLISENSVGHNDFGEEIIKGYYPCKNSEELEKLIDYIIIKGQDNLREVRETINEKININQGIGTGRRIYEYILEVINEK